MPYLNIPMRSGGHTARRHRRAVWLLIGLALGFFGLLWGISVLWFTRDTLSGHAPENTAVVIHLTPDPDEWLILRDDFGSIPLISGQFLSIHELSAFTLGELAIFVGQDGTTSVAVRTKEALLPKSLLDAYGISYQQLGRGTYLLSSKPIAFSPNKSTRLNFRALFPGNMGTVSIPDELSASIDRTTEGYALHLPKLHLPSIPNQKLPTGTVAALLLPATPTGPLTAVSGRIDLLLAPIGIGGAGQIVEASAEHESLVLLATDEQSHLQSLIRFRKDDSQSPTELLKAISSLNQAHYRDLSLPDGTVIQEIYIDPTLVVVEETQIAGFPAARTSVGTQEFIVVTEQENVYLSTNQTMIESWLAPEPAGKSCGGKAAAFVNPRGLTDTLMNTASVYDASAILLFSHVFNEITLNEGLFGDKISFCRA